MKRNFKILLNTILGLCILFLTSCDFFSMKEDKTSYEVVSVTPDIDFSGSSRKISTSENYSDLTLKLNATCNTNAELSKTIEVVANTPFELYSGNWSFELTAYMNEVAVLASKENQNIDISEDTTLGFTLSGENLNGFFEYTVPVGLEFQYEDTWTEEQMNTSLNDTVTTGTQIDYELTVYACDGNYDTVVNSDTKTDIGYSYYSTSQFNQNLDLTLYTAHITKSISVALPEGNYYITCKDEDNKFLFTELVEIKSGLKSIRSYSPDNKPSYSIKFHTNGGIFNTSMIQQDESGLYTFYYNISGTGNVKSINFKNYIKEPLKDNCIFQGWYYDSDFKTPVSNLVGDGISNISSDDIKYASNIELYAKWLEYEGGRPPLLMYRIGPSAYYDAKHPKITSNWNESLQNISYDSTDLITVDIQANNSDIYAIMSNENKDSFYLCIEKEGNDPDFKEISIDNFSPVKLAYDKVNDKIQILLQATESGEDRKLSYSLLTYSDGEFSENVSLDFKVCCKADARAFGADNDELWISYYNFYNDTDANPSQMTVENPEDYNPEEDYINLLYIVTMEDGSVKDTVIKNAPDYFVCIPSELNSLKKYAYIKDFAFGKNKSNADKVFAVVKLSQINTNYFSLLYDGKSVGSFGGIIEITPDSLLTTSLLSFAPEYKKTLSLTYDGEEVTYDYYGVSSHRDTKILAGPTRILAIKNKELIMVDEGAFVWVADSKKAYAWNVNRVVSFDLEKGSVKYVCPVDSESNNFENSFSTSGTQPAGFISLYGSASSLF